MDQYLQRFGVLERREIADTERSKGESSIISINKAAELGGAFKRKVKLRKDEKLYLAARGLNYQGKLGIHSSGHAVREH